MSIHVVHVSRHCVPQTQGEGVAEQSYTFDCPPNPLDMKVDHMDSPRRTYYDIWKSMATPTHKDGHVPDTWCINHRLKLKKRPDTNTGGIRHHHITYVDA